MLLGFVCVAIAVATAAALPTLHGSRVDGNLPVFRISGTPYEVGHAVGQNFASQFATFVQTYPDLKNIILPYYNTPAGKAAVDAFDATNRAAFPDQFQEMQGLADGSGIPYETIWLLNIREEIMLLAANGSANASSLRVAPILPTSCSDVHVRSHSFIGYGHNEDNDVSVRPGAYLLIANYTGGSNIVAYCYPTLLPGNAFGFNSLGTTVTLNALSPNDVVIGGLARQFLNRDLLNADSVEDALKRLTRGPSACGFSANIGSTVSVQSVNVEVGPGRKVISVKSVDDDGHVYHFNDYLRLNVSEEPDDSSVHRLARANQMNAPYDVNGIIAILGDTQDVAYPIYRNGAPPDTDDVTLATMLYDLKNAKAQLYVNSNPKLSSPVMSFDLPVPKSRAL